MAVTTKTHGMNYFSCESTDTKPTAASHGVKELDSLFESDTSLMYTTPDGTNWVVKNKVVLTTETGDSITDDTADASRVIPTWTFGEPTLQAQGNGSANWSRGTSLISTHQKSSTGWLANLDAGLQTSWDDAAECYIPVNEMPLTDLTVGTTMWSYYMTGTEIGGVGMVIWVHDPTDSDRRAEITLLSSTGHMEIAAGWNAHELAAGNDAIWYGENTGTHGTTVTAGTAYDFSQYLADDVFSTYTIYRISFFSGYENTSTYEPVYLADVKINGTVIPLKPDNGGSGRIVQKNFTVAAGDLTGTIAPRTPFRLLSLDVHVSAIPDTTEVLTLTKDAGQGSLYDTVLLSEDLFVGSRTSYFAILGEGYDFTAEDEIDLFQTNGSDDDWGVTITYQTVY